MRERGDFLGADEGMQLVDNRVSDPKFKYSGWVLSYSIIICIVCHTVKPDFVASVEHERLQARRCREAAPERDARVDDLRQRAQARRHREATPERDALVHDQRQRAQLSQETQEATPERDARLDGQRRRTQARRHREATTERWTSWCSKTQNRSQEV